MTPSTDAVAATDSRVDGPVGRIAPCRIIDLPEFVDPRGSLCVVDTGGEIDFTFKRAYYMYSIPPGAARGAHGHRRLRQVIIAVHGSFDVVVDDGFNRSTFHLDHPTKGLYMGPMVWRDMINFTPGTVGLWLVSDHYDADEYYRDYDEFLRDARSVQ